MFWKKPAQVKLFRTLRFRLAVTFLLLLTGVLLIMGFVGTTTLRTVLENQSEDEVNEQLGSLKGWIQFYDDSGRPYWFADLTDPEEKAEVSRLQAVYVIADDQGRVELGSSESALKPLFDPKTIVSEMARMQQTHEPVLKTIIGADKDAVSGNQQHTDRREARPQMVCRRRTAA